MTILISSDVNGVFGNGSSKSKAASANGRYIVIESNATNLVTGDTNGATDVFIKDLQTGTITMVSTDASPVGRSKSPASGHFKIPHPDACLTAQQSTVFRSI